MTTKRRRASETLQRAEDQDARASSLFFMAGTRVRLEEVEGSRVVVMKRGETEATVTTTEADGGLEFDVPASLYPEPDTNFYLVCDTPIEARSFRVPERNKVMDLEEERGLDDLIKRQREAALEFLKKFQTSDSKESLQGLRDNLKESKADALKKRPKDQADLEQMMAELKGIDDMLSTVKVQLDQLEKSPEEVKDTTSKADRVRMELVDQIHAIQLECVHMLATERGDTEETLETWKERATGLDFAAAGEVLKLGNAASTSTEAPKPLSQEELRRIAMKRAKILN